MATSNVIAIERHFEASPERVFAAWTSPADLEEWLADRATVNLAVEGSFRLETDGGEELPGLHVCSGHYTVVESPVRLVKTWRYEGPDPDDTVETIISVNLVPAGDGVLMQFREEGEGLDTAEERAFALDAWNGAFEALAALVED